MDSKKLKRAADIVVATLPVVVGGLIYVAFRPDSLLMFDWFAGIGQSASIEAFRLAVQHHRPHDLIVTSAPAGLWALSCTALLRIVWVGQRAALALPFLSLPIFVGVGSEVAQAFALCPGTFDPTDIFFYLAGSLVGAIFPTH